MTMNMNNTAVSNIMNHISCWVVATKNFVCGQQLSPLAEVTVLGANGIMVSAPTDRSQRWQENALLCQN